MDAWQKYHKTLCTSLPEDEHLDVRNMSKTLQLNWNINEKVVNFWFLLHRYITMHCWKNVKLKFYSFNKYKVIIIHKKNIQQDATMYQNFIIPYLYEAQHVSGDNTAQHQEPKTALAASGFSYVKGCWTCRWWTLSGTVCLTTSTIYTSNNLSRMKNQRLPVLF